MGALTSNRRKRTDEYTTTLIPKFPSLYSPNFHNRIDTHISKKPKTTHMDKPSPDRPISRPNMYPEPVNQIRRQVHAPCRVSKFGFRSSSNLGNGFVQEEDLADVKGSVLSLQYDEAKDCAIRALRYLNLKKDKEVIEVVDIAESDKDDDVSPNSSIEVVEDRREGKALEGDFGPSSSSVNVDLGVENAGKMLDSLSLNKGLDVLELPVHKKLFEEAERRNSKLSSLSYYIELNKTRLAALQSLRPLKKPEEEDVFKDELREPFVALTKEEEVEVSRAFSNSNRRKVLVTHENSNIEITGEVLQCLRPGAWLNDEVINLYLELLKEREKRKPKFFLKCHFFNTFFFKKLISGRTGYDFKSVQRWTTQKKLGYCLLECDKIFVPIHKEIHWCLAVINKKDEKFQYLDSLGGSDTQVLKVLARYFMDEVKDKSGEQIDLSSWKHEYVEDLTQQENGWDCGMFMIKYTDFYSRGLGLCFNQEHMPYFRLRTAKEILRLKAE